jgi:hypothetical protein
MLQGLRSLIPHEKSLSELIPCYNSRLKSLGSSHRVPRKHCLSAVFSQFCLLVIFSLSPSGQDSNTEECLLASAARFLVRLPLRWRSSLHGSILPCSLLSCWPVKFFGPAHGLTEPSAVISARFWSGLVSGVFVHASFSSCRRQH